MIRKRSLFLLFLGLAFRINAIAQVSMTAQVPPEGVLMKAQLWNIALVSVSDVPVTAKVMLRLTDIRTNQPVLTAITKSITLVKGARQFRVGDLSPIEYEYLTDVADRTSNGLLPVGNYQACYSVYIQNTYKGDLLSEDCIPFAVSPVGPPLLNTPADQSIVETFNPQFTWLPPSPVSVFSNLNYELLLTELRSGQSAVEAVQQNLPVYRLPSTKNLFANYPSSALSLDTGKQYAWTIIARNGNSFAAQTDIWTFRLKSEIVRKDNNEQTYVQLKRELDAAITTVAGNVYFTYTNTVNDSHVSYELVALQSGDGLIVSGELSVTPGDNMIAFEIKRKFKLQDGKSYLMRVKNSRNEYFQMKFIYTR